MIRLRPSLRKLEKAEVAAQSGPGFKSTYDAHKAARKRVLNRLDAALDRIDVASQFSEFTGATVAQLGHAQRFIERGRDEPEGWPFTVDDETAAELVQRLATMLHDAYVAELMDRAAARLPSEEGRTEAAPEPTA